MDEIHVPGYCKHLLEQLCILWEKKVLCDVKLCSQDGEMLAHKLVLVGASPYLATLLSDDSSKLECTVNSLSKSVDNVTKLTDENVLESNAEIQNKTGETGNKITVESVNENETENAGERRQDSGVDNKQSNGENMAEKSDRDKIDLTDENRKILKFDTVSQDNLQTVLRLLYTGVLNINKETAEGVRKFCELLQLKTAVEAVKKYVDDQSNGAQERENGGTRENKVRLKLRVKHKEEKETVHEPVRKKRKYTPRKVKVETSGEASRRSRIRKAPNPKRKSARKVQNVPSVKERQKIIIKQEVTDDAADISVHDRDESDSLVDSQRNEDTEGLEVKGETAAADEFSEDQDKLADYDSDTDNVEIDSDFDAKKSYQKTTKPKTKRDLSTAGAKRGRKPKVVDPDAEPRPKLPKKRRKKEFPCAQCPKILSSFKRKVFHEFSKHGTPFDTSKYQMVPCKEEVSVVLLRLCFLSSQIIDHLGLYIRLFANLRGYG